MAHLTFLLLLLWVAVTVSTVVDLQKRIYGGIDCNQNERRYHVSLTLYADGRCSHCGGSLIKNQWILTAAHCRSRPMFAVVGVHAGQRNVQRIEEINIITHQHDDIMLVKLSNPTAGIPTVPYCPNINNDPTINLKCATMDVVNCNNPFLSTFYQQNPPDVPQQNRLCLQRHGVDVRPGDSGGGVIHRDNLYGVIIATGELACTCETLSIRVCPYMTWINQNAGLKT
uniref:Peptidase S1 domain-containing protein n=1 Tax=Pundamilia nyererei TaxID=303518 RepID=A0A3B4HCZ8_9CICH